MAINLLTSDYEPTDEELEEIMAAAAREAEKGTMKPIRNCSKKLKWKFKEFQPHNEDQDVEEKIGRPPR